MLRIVLSKETSSMIFDGLFFHSGPPKSLRIATSSSLSDLKKDFQLESTLVGFFLNLKKSSAM